MNRVTKLYKKTLQYAPHIAVVSALLVLFAAFSMKTVSAPFASSELQFADASASGLEIIPASCPSSPHYIGECGCTGTACPPPPCPPGRTYNSTRGLCTDVDGPDPLTSGSGCVITLNPPSIQTGGSATLSWNSWYRLYGIPVPTTGTITPEPGTVPQSQSITVRPAQTTVYTGTFYPVLTGVDVGGGAMIGLPQSYAPVTCSATLVVSNEPSVQQCTEALYCRGNDVFRRTTSCVEQFVRTCTYGCSNGVCLPAPSPAGSIHARPALVRFNTSTTIEWNANNVTACTVTGTNGDSWTGTSGSKLSSKLTAQAIYTLSCTGLDRSTFVREVTANITPIFDEQ